MIPFFNSIRILQPINHKQLYWFCQCAGWFGMVGIETINYTFFIVGKFNADLLWWMVLYAVMGICCTHVYRYFFKRTDLFQKKGIRTWLSAFIATLSISTILSIIGFLPSAFSNFSAFIHELRVVDVVGTIINWMRYVGVWVIIYFMYKILQRNSVIEQKKISLESLAKTTGLELLKTQLNPHFLFNALNSIKALVTINPEQSREAFTSWTMGKEFKMLFDIKMFNKKEGFVCAANRDDITQSNALILYTKDVT